MTLDLATLAIFVLATIGGTYITTESAIARPLRIFLATRAPKPLDELVYCARCTAFWIGLALALAVVLGAPPWSMLPFAAVGVARVVWGGLVEQEKTLAGDAEWLRNRSQDGREPTAGPAAEHDGSEDRDRAGGEKARKAAGQEEGAVRDADEASGGDGGPVQHYVTENGWVHCKPDAPCRAEGLRRDGTCGCCCCTGRSLESSAASGLQASTARGCPCDVCAAAAAKGA